MSPVELLGLEFRGFLALLAAMLVYRMLTRQITLRGLFASKDGTHPVTPERVQLFLATLAMSAQYIGGVIHGGGSFLPDVNGTWLTLFGASSGAYAAVKIARTALTKAK